MGVRDFHYTPLYVGILTNTPPIFFTLRKAGASRLHVCRRVSALEAPTGRRSVGHPPAAGSMHDLKRITVDIYIKTNFLLPMLIKCLLLKLKQTS